MYLDVVRHLCRSSPPENFKFRVSEMPFPAFSAGHFQHISLHVIRIVGKCSSWLFISLISSVVGEVQCLREKKAIDPFRIIE